MKLANVTPILESGKKVLLTSYRQISILLRFSKMLERFMYNRLHSYLNDSSLLFHQQFGFGKDHFTDHALFELTDGIYNSFNQNKYTLQQVCS